MGTPRRRGSKSTTGRGVRGLRSGSESLTPRLRRAAVGEDGPAAPAEETDKIGDEANQPVGAISVDAPPVDPRARLALRSFPVDEHPPGPPDVRDGAAGPGRTGGTSPTGSRRSLSPPMSAAISPQTE